MASRPIARVLLRAPLPQLDRLLDYEIPAELRDSVTAGVRVRVPLRGAKRLVEGYVVELAEAEDPDRPLSAIEALQSAAPVLPFSLYTLARRVADRAAGSASDVLRLVIPNRQVRIERAWMSRTAASDTVNAEDVPAGAAEALEAYPGLAAAIVDRSRIALNAPPRTARAPDGQTVGAWATLLAAAAATAFREGRSAILAVPDHRDLDQLELALAGHVPADALVRDDSGHSPAQRSRAYLRMLESQPCVVIGNRSAVYAPVAALGLIAVWDDGDPLYDEPLAPYVNARDVALIRQELDGCALLFAGHTRTTDVQRLVGIGWLREIDAARRVTPRIVLSPPDAPGAVRVTSAAFRAAGEALAHGPVLVQVARPGYAPVLSCAECRSPARCASCGGSLHATRRGAVPECRWCGRAAHAWACAKCDGTRLRLATAGSIRTADELGRAFPGTRVILSDGDHPVLRVDARPALVVATRGAEPIAENGYRAVLLLDGGRMLQAESLRIGESCLRWWSNAAALAAPGAPVHLSGVTGSIARALATWTQGNYAQSELRDRAELRLPPTVRVASVEGDAATLATALGALREAVPALADDDILGPVARPPSDPPTQPPGEASSYRALVRFDYGAGAAVTASLRGSVIAAALRVRRSSRGARASTGLRVRVDVPEPDL